MPPTFRVVITREVLADLEEIFTYIHQDSPENAPTVIRNLLKAIDALEEMPGRHPAVGRTRSGNSEVRKVVVRPYIVYYRVERPTLRVVVLSVLHGARRQPKRFG